MYEAFVTAFIIYSVVIDHVGNMPIFLAVTQHQNRVSKLRTALDGKIVATMIMVFFALCRGWVLAYLKITEAAFRIGGGIIMFLVALEMLSAERQWYKHVIITSEDDTNKPKSVDIFPLVSYL